MLLALVMPSLRQRRTRRAAVVGAGVAVASTPLLPAGLPVLLALAGLAARGRAAAGPKTTGAVADDDAPGGAS